MGTRGKGTRSGRTKKCNQVKARKNGEIRHQD